VDSSSQSGRQQQNGKNWERRNSKVITKLLEAIHMSKGEELKRFSFNVAGRGDSWKYMNLKEIK